MIIDENGAMSDSFEIGVFNPNTLDEIKTTGNSSLLEDGDGDGSEAAFRIEKLSVGDGFTSSSRPNRQ